MNSNNDGWNTTKNQLIQKSEKSEEAQKWDGWGTALKPAQEPAILARKPLSESSIARQVLKTKTGGLNIDGCRFGYGDECWVGPQETLKSHNGFSSCYDDPKKQRIKADSYFVESNPLGRWPANIYQCPKPSRAERDEGLEHQPSQLR